MTKIEMVRLIADEGKILTNGKIQAGCIDTFADKVDEWTEIDAPKETENDVPKEDVTE